MKFFLKKCKIIFYLAKKKIKKSKLSCTSLWPRVYNLFFFFKVQFVEWKNIFHFLVDDNQRQMQLLVRFERKGETSSGSSWPWHMQAQRFQYCELSPRLERKLRTQTAHKSSNVSWYLEMDLCFNCRYVFKQVLTFPSHLESLRKYSLGKVNVFEGTIFNSRNNVALYVEKSSSMKPS
jgi:hypothetical protein